MLVHLHDVVENIFQRHLHEAAGARQSSLSNGCYALVHRWYAVYARLFPTGASAPSAASTVPHHGAPRFAFAAVGLVG